MYKVEGMQRDLPATFGEILRRYRQAAHLSQEELSERAGLSKRAISDLERGVNRSPRHATLALLADALQLTPPERLRFEVAAWPAAVPAPQSAEPEAGPPFGYIPAPLTSFIGREAEVDWPCASSGVRVCALSASWVAAAVARPAWPYMLPPSSPAISPTAAGSWTSALSPTRHASFRPSRVYLA